jgi:hypothetical protein
MADPIPLYRYLSSDGALKTLVAGKFRVGMVSKFNDPFEWKLGFTGMRTPEEQKSAENFSSEHVRWMESWMGILCFSNTLSLPVLWALYAEKHRGAVFEVKYSWPDDILHKMTYLPDRPVLDFNRLREIASNEMMRKQYFLTLIKGLMSNKSPGFIFEQEYRLQIDLTDRKYCEYSDGNYEWRLPEKSLTRVILGFCSPLKETVVRKLLDMNGFTGTELVRAKMCQETYSIII